MNTVATYTPYNSPNQIIRFNDNLKFRVYYLEAPLSFLGERLGINVLNNLISINGFHTAIGFQCTDKNTPYEFTFDVDITSGFIFDSILPKIITNPDGTKDLVWNNAQEVTLGNFIDKFYWERSTYICTTTGQDIFKIQEWILNTWIPNNPIYSLFSAVKSVSPDDLFNTLFRASICDTFCYSMLYYIRGTDGGSQLDPVFNNNNPGLRVCIEYATVPNVSINTFIIPFQSMLIPVDFVSNKNAIIAFYEQFESDLSQLTVIKSNIEQLLQQFQQAPPDQKLDIAKQIAEQISDAIILLLTVYSTFPVAYYYGYSGNQIQYWQINNPDAVALYTNSNLTRSYPAWTVGGGTVVDDFTDPIDCNCNCQVNSESSTSTIWFYILIIIIVIIIIIFIIYVIVSLI
jgi:hypothetical protein